MFTVSPSIYSADLLNLKEVLDKTSSFEHIHLDIDDGNFVKGISFGVDLISQIKKNTNVPLDVHLEVLNPMDYIDELCELGMSLIVAHIETLKDPKEFIDRVHAHNIKVGFAINVGTSLDKIKPYLNDIDHLIFVSVVSGEKGLPFRKEVLDNVKEIKKLLDNKISIWVDGAVNESNLKDVVKAGATGVVIGRAVFKADDYNAAYNKFLELGRLYEKMED
ncbi:MAG: ribulose-phosphate 3-epimerase [Erysipelotrichaceae bacterium]|nr:ribulose-phosphate 3-epimerase [Erysipelotrichaceae bacterium]